MHYISLIILSIILSPFLARQIKPKFCVDCKHFIKNSFITNKYGKCALFNKHEEYNDYFLVDGNMNDNEIDYFRASTARTFDYMCGEEGKFFEKKTTHSNKKSCK